MPLQQDKNPEEADERRGEERMNQNHDHNHNHNHNHNPQSSGEGGRHDDGVALTHFVASLMDYTPTIPDELVEHYLASQERLSISLSSIPAAAFIVHISSASFTANTHHYFRTRLVAVATHKFVAEVAGDALQHCKARQATIPKDKRDRQQKDNCLVLTMEDLTKALHDYGVNVRHQEYFADSPSTGMDPAALDE